MISLFRISQKENSASMKSKLDAHLIQVAERIHTLKLVYRTTANRWNAFLLYMGYAPTEIHDQKPTVTTNNSKYASEVECEFILFRLSLKL